jgi:hypothetical protein
MGFRGFREFFMGLSKEYFGKFNEYFQLFDKCWMLGLGFETISKNFNVFGFIDLEYHISRFISVC